MKVLWFEVTAPSRCLKSKNPIAGWQDALENIVLQCDDIELFISFESKNRMVSRTIDGVTYLPFKIQYSYLERKKNEWNYNVYADKVLASVLKIVVEVRPDIIHIFGNEWPYGLIANQVDIPVVIHIQGSIIPYTNADYPPGYNYWTMCRYNKVNLKKYYCTYKSYKRRQSHLSVEHRIWNTVHYYMGRTCWDKSLVETLSSNSRYYHVEEALREQFLKTSKRWNPIKDGKIRLVTVGMSTFWKGPDMLLKTAHILKGMAVDFEWYIVGIVKPSIKEVVEKKEKTTFESNNVHLLGMKRPEELIDILCNSTIYVHTAYIENSPNSICEAQYLGVPIISTHVGGIETLLDNGKDGVLVPANDPWRMTYEILRMVRDNSIMKEYGRRSQEHAQIRHNPDKILSELLNCYRDIIIHNNEN